MQFDHVIIVVHAQNCFCFFYDSIICMPFKITFGYMVILDGRGVYCLMNQRQLSLSQVFQSKENNIPLCYRYCIMNPNGFLSG